MQHAMKHANVQVFKGRPGEPKYTISVLTNQHPKYEKIKEQVRDSWKHPGNMHYDMWHNM